MPARVKNVFGRDLIAAGRLVAAGQEIEVPDDLLESFAGDTRHWAQIKQQHKKSGKPADDSQEG
jgi:hypothetical protein